MIIFKNPGVISAHGLMTFGLCAKDPTSSTSPIGYFGTGLKYALAVLMREGAKVRIHRGVIGTDVSIEPTTVRNQDFGVVMLGTHRLPFTTDLGKNWTLWQAYRELYANTLDEKGTITHTPTEGADPIPSPKPTLGCETEPVEGHTMISVEHPEFDKIHLEGNVFLSTTPLYTFKGVEFHESGRDIGNWIYYKGIRAHELPKHAFYNYNITDNLKLTEDRTLDSLGYVYRAIANAVAGCNNEPLIRRMLEAHQRQFESTIDWWWATQEPSDSFHSVLYSLGASHTSYNSSAGTYYKEHRPDKEVPEVADLLSIPLKDRHKLKSARMFWEKLGYDYSGIELFVAEEVEGTKRYEIFQGQIYISKKVLGEDMRLVTGTLLKAFLVLKYKNIKTPESDILADTVVEFGERILGLSVKPALNVSSPPPSPLLPLVDESIMQGDDIPF